MTFFCAQVFERMAGYDLGCGPGGGQTAAKIFKVYLVKYGLLWPRLDSSTVLV